AYAYYGQSGGSGLNGTATYSYAVPSNDGGDWWGYAAANIYTNTATVPTMPWRNPLTASEGIMWGRVQDGQTGLYVDDATVAVTGGPTVKTDANGYYVATLVPASGTGTVHSATASKTGLTSQTIANAVVLPGDIVRYDFTLNAPSLAPSGLTATPISSSQINLAWTNNAGNATGNIVSRSTTSGGPYTDIASVAGSATTYSNTGLAANTTYSYVVRATNSFGPSPYSNEASATTAPAVPTPPSIITQPQSQTVIAGQNASFTVAAGGSLPLSYQWRFNGANIAGATTTSFTRFNAQLADAGTYLVLVTNSLGGTSSAPATLTVVLTLTANATEGGTISRNPDQPTYSPNSTVTLTATPDPGFSFTGWSGDASGTTNPLDVLMTTNKTITASFAGASTDLILDNTNAAVTFIGGWQTGSSSTDKYGPDYRFASTVAGGTSNAIYRPNITAPGYYDVYLWYPQGSNRATNAPWSIVYDGGTVNVAVNQTTNGGGWRLIAAAKPFQAGTNGYVQLSNNTGYSGKVVLADAVRFVYVGGIVAAPGITSQPQDQIVAPGGIATFTVTATPSGSGLTYQWRFNGANLPGATNTTYTRPNVQASDAGLYSVVVSNLAGVVTSSSATLTIGVPPSITTQPQSQTVLAGSSALFSVAASGTPAPQYQWRFNGVDLPGAIVSSFTVSPVRAVDAGAYSVLVTNPFGGILSANASLTLATVGAAGDNSAGQILVPPQAANLVALAAGAWHSLALKANGTVLAWGDDSLGQTDLPSGAHISVVPVVAIAAGGYHTLAIRANGTVLAWGANDYGGVIAIAGGTRHSLALKADGTVAAWGDESLGQTDTPPELAGVVAIAAGGSHNLALKSDGTVAAWGDNTDANGIFVGQSVVPAGLANVVAIAAGDYHSLAVRNDGTVVAWGDDSQSQSSVPAGLAGVVAVAAGRAHSLALKTDGTVAAWGANLNGQCDLPVMLTTAVALAAGAYHSLALVDDGTFVPRLFSPAWNSGRFAVLVQTLNRKNYAFEYKSSLAATNWTAISNLEGNAGLRLLSDPGASLSRRFYRVRQWP
ncbi:MAG: hypothetical protein DME25_12050, partial [Verrucomicrobia bacterium]